MSPTIDIIVVANAITTKIEKTSVPMTPSSSPIEAMISSTAPLLFIARPIPSDSIRFSLVKRAAMPHPMTFPAVATMTMTTAKSAAVLKAEKSRWNASDAKKIGPKKL